MNKLYLLLITPNPPSHTYPHVLTSYSAKSGWQLFKTFHLLLSDILLAWAQCAFHEGGLGSIPCTA